MRKRLGTNPPQVDVHNAQAQYLFTVSISNLGQTMRKYTELMHIALHSIFVCCNLTHFADWHNVTTFIEENLLVR